MFPDIHISLYLFVWLCNNMSYEDSDERLDVLLM